MPFIATSKDPLVQQVMETLGIDHLKNVIRSITIRMVAMQVVVAEVEIFITPQFVCRVPADLELRLAPPDGYKLAITVEAGGARVITAQPVEIKKDTVQ